MGILSTYFAHAGKANGALAAGGVTIVSSAILFGADIDMETRHKMAIMLAIALIAGIFTGIGTKLGEKDARGYNNYVAANRKQGEKGYAPHNAEPEHTFSDKFPKISNFLLGGAIGALAGWGLTVYAQDMGIDNLTNDTGLFIAGMAFLVAASFISLTSLKQASCTNREDIEDRSEKDDLPKDKKVWAGGFVGSMVGAGIASAVLLTAMENEDLSVKVMTAAAIIFGAYTLSYLTSCAKLFHPSCQGSKRSHQQIWNGGYDN